MKWILLAMIMTCTLYCDAVSNDQLTLLYTDDKFHNCVKNLAGLYDVLCRTGDRKVLATDPVSGDDRHIYSYVNTKRAEACCQRSCSPEELKEQCFLFKHINDETNIV